MTKHVDVDNSGDTAVYSDDLEVGQNIVVTRGPMVAMPIPVAATVIVRSDTDMPLIEDRSLCEQVFEIIAISRPYLLASRLVSSPVKPNMQQVGDFLVQFPSDMPPRAIWLDTRDVELGAVDEQFADSYAEYFRKMAPDVQPPKFKIVCQPEGAKSTAEESED